MSHEITLDAATTTVAFSIEEGIILEGIDGEIITIDATRDDLLAAIEADRAQRHTGAPTFPIDDALAYDQPPVGRVFVEAVTETPLTEAQFEAVCRYVPHSSIPDALRIIVGEVLA